MSLAEASVTAVAVPIIAVVYRHTTREPLGILSAAALLPLLVLELPAGAWIDRMPDRLAAATTGTTGCVR